MKTIFAIKHTELKITLLVDSIHTIHPNGDLFHRNEISMKDLIVRSPNFIDKKEFCCDKVEILEVNGAGIKINIYQDNQLIDSEFYVIKRYNENMSNIYINDKPLLLTSGFLY